MGYSALLLSLFLAYTGAYVARTPLHVGGARSAISHSSAPLMAPALAPMRKHAVTMGLGEMEPATQDEETCIEDEAIEECVLASWPAGQIKVPMSLFKTAKLGLCFFAWFFLNVMYNITNKKCQNAFPMPWTRTVVSLFVGVPYILLLWASGLRKAPKVKALQTSANVPMHPLWHLPVPPCHLCAAPRHKDDPRAHD